MDAATMTKLYKDLSRKLTAASNALETLEDAMVKLEDEDERAAVSDASTALGSTIEQAMRDLSDLEDEINALS